MRSENMRLADVLRYLILRATRIERDLGDIALLFRGNVDSRE